MVQRIVFVVLGVSVLTGLIVYSQWRSRPDFVSGIIEAEETRIGSRIGGRVRAVLANEGDQVSEDAVLIELDPYDLEARIAQANAELSAREAQLRRLKSGLRLEEVAQAKARLDQWNAKLSLLEAGPRKEEIEAARNRLTVAEVESTLASRNYDRASSLRETRAIAEAEYERAREFWDSSKANLLVRQNELAILEAGSRPEELDHARASAEEARQAWELAKEGYHPEEVKQAEASRDAAAAAIDVLQTQERELKIVAPSPGYVDALKIYPGDLVAPNAPVLTLIARNHLWVRAYVPQRFLQLSVGQQVRVTIDSLPGKDFRGEVSFIASQAEFTPSNVQTSDDRAKQVYRIRVALAAESNELRPGMTANVWLPPSVSRP